LASVEFEDDEVDARETLSLSAEAVVACYVGPMQTIIRHVIRNMRLAHVVNGKRTADEFVSIGGATVVAKTMTFVAKTIRRLRNYSETTKNERWAIEPHPPDSS